MTPVENHPNWSSDEMDAAANFTAYVATPRDSNCTVKPLTLKELWEQLNNLKRPITEESYGL